MNQPDSMIVRTLPRTVLLRAFTIALFVALLALIASTYIGHSPSPYGMCFGSTGRTIPCAVAKSPQPAHPKT